MLDCATTPPASALVEAFPQMAGLLGLEKRDHAHAAGVIVINLQHFDREAAAAKLRVPPLQEFRRVLRRGLSPRFIDSNRTVRSTLVGRAIKCWIFEETAPA